MQKQEIHALLPTLSIQSDIDYGGNFILCSRESISEASDSFSCSSSHNNENGTEITFTPRGTVANTALIKLGISDYDQLRCIAVTSPLGLIRQGIDNGDGCNFNTTY